MMTEKWMNAPAIISAPAAVETILASDLPAQLFAEVGGGNYLALHEWLQIFHLHAGLSDPDQRGFGQAVANLRVYLLLEDILQEKQKEKADCCGHDRRRYPA